MQSKRASAEPVAPSGVRRGFSLAVAPVAALVVLLAACGESPEPRATAEQFIALGTVVTVRYFDPPPAAAKRATAALNAWLRERGTDWYPWADGELRRVNAAIAAGKPVDVSASLASLLRRAARLEELTGGLFNPALGALTELWGFHEPSTGAWRPPRAAEVGRRLASGPSATSLGWDGDRLVSAAPDVMLDPGGIAKGALLAESVELLARHGITDAIVDLGGDLIVSGSAGGRAARVGIREPGTERAVGWLEAAPGEAVLTSGNYERFFEYEGRRYAHVLDPRTGYPATGTASVTVVHRDPVLADAAATALLVGGAGRFEALCGQLGIEQALLITAMGDVRLTPALAARVHWLGNGPGPRAGATGRPRNPQSEAVSQ